MPSILARVRSALPLLVLAAACGGKVTAGPMPVTTPGNPSPHLETVLKGLEAQLASCGIPGASIAVVENGRLTDRAGLGVRPGTDTPITASTLFVSGQASMVPLAVTAIRLVEEGKLDLSRPVTDYVPLHLAPGFDPGAITVGQLLLHTSGLPEIPTGECGPTALGDWFASQAASPLWSPPGAVWNFSHRNYAALAWVVEAASGLPFADAVAARAFGPAGMSTATYDVGVAGGRGLTGGVAVDPDSHATTASSGKLCGVTAPADGVMASALDYASLAETLLAGGGRMLSSASVTTLETGQTLDYRHPGETYAYGLYREEVLDGVSALVAGSSPTAYGAYLWLVPDRDFAVVVMFDGYNASPSCTPFDAARLATATYLGLGDASSPSWTTPPSTWAPLVGVYADTTGRGTVTVSLDGDVLTMTTAQFGAVPLVQSSATSFTGVFGSSPGRTQVLFEPAGSQQAAWVATSLGVGKRQ